MTYFVKLNAIAVTTLLVVANSAFAHHSNAPHFDVTVEVIKHGIVTDWKFVNPHAYLYFDVTSEGGQITSWRCEAPAASLMRARGYSQDTFVYGQAISVAGNPARREANVCAINRFIFADGTEVARNSSLPDNKAVARDILTQDIDKDRAHYLSDGQPNISGYWVRAPRERSVSGGMGGMSGGGMGAGGTPKIALTDAGKTQFPKYQQIYDDPSIHCTIANIFFAWGHDGHVNKVTQENDTITLLYGYMDYKRTIHLNLDEHPNSITPTIGGHSIGRWEGDVLVVDTIGFLPSVLHPLSGIPYSEQMHSIEKFSYDHERKTLERSYVVTDPLYLETAYTGQDSQIISMEPYTPYDCVELSGDNNKRPEEQSK